MYLQQLISQKQAQIPRARTQVASIPAPVFGWNARDPLSDMDPRFALVLDNYFPDGNDVRQRLGNVQHATGFTGNVETLHVARFGNSEQLIAFANNASYNATGGGAIGGPLGSGFTNSRWIGANAGASGGETALYTNGVDPAQAYDGTAWGASTITGPSKPTGITVAHKRVWVIDNGTGDAWYGAVEAVGGAFTKFSIGTVVPSGGDLIAISAMTLDGGNGPEDVTIFVMRSGAIVVYAGFDPSDAANWALRGVWQGGHPIGDRCLVPFDKDVIYISDAGFQSILAFTTGGGVSGVPISDNIRRAVSDAARDFAGNFGWNGVFDPRTRQLVMNIPVVEGRTSEQYAMNTSVAWRPWCRFKDVNLFSQAVTTERRYVGVNGAVWIADSGGTDVNEPIAGTWQSAWSYFQPRGQEKIFRQFRPHIRSDSNLNLSTGFGTDFRDPNVTAVGGSSGQTGGKWNESQWNTTPWASGLRNERPWLGAFNNGYNGSVVIKTQTSNVTVQILATDVVYETGDIL